MNHTVPRQDDALQAWWHPVTLDNGQGWHAMIGPLSVYLRRKTHEWQLCWENVAESDERSRAIGEPIESFPEGLTANRFVFRDAPPGFLLTPKLLDRPMVVRTEEPVMIPAGENILFYISSPVCVEVRLDGLKAPLKELASVQLSDTWFGPNTREGEMCYAAKTRARNNKDDVLIRPHRAVTPVTLHNRSEELLAIEKLSIPLPFLATYSQADRSLWTDAVSLEHRGDGELATMKIGRKPEQAERVSAARSIAPKNTVVRAFMNLFTD